MSDGDAHPDWVRLDAVRAGEPVDPADAAHVATCGRCRSAVSELGSAATDLKLLHEPARGVAQQRDDRILRMARERSAQVREAGTDRRRSMRTAGVWVAVAGLALTAALLGARRDQFHDMRRLVQVAPGPPIAPAVSASVADLDGDGRVTVLDALILSRAVEAGRRDAAFDVNRDGRVDEDDVNAVLALAVSVGSR